MAHRTKSLISAILALAALAAPAVAQAPAIPREAIEQIVREYILKNPEIVRDALTELEHRQQEEQKTSQREAIRKESAVLFNSPRGNIVGNAAGDTTLVEFFDYNCGYCKRSLGDMRTLMKSDPKLRVVLKDFPVLGPDSLEASRVALAAKLQLQGDRLFEYHAKLMDSRGRVNGERALAVAKEMGLDLPRLQRDVESTEVRAAIQENVELGDRLGLTGTPAFVIGDEIISGAVGVEPMRQAVASLRRCGRASC